jgi:Effector-associated domain 7
MTNQSLPPSLADLVQLRRTATQAFNLDEVKTLCADLRVGYDALSGENKEDKVRELIELLVREERVVALALLCAQQRPHLTWPLTGTTPTAAGNAVPPASVVAGLGSDADGSVSSAAPIQQPRSIQKQVDGDTLTLSLRWITQGFWVSFFIWAAVISFITLILYDNEPQTRLLLVLPCLIFGGGLTYWFVALCINRTICTVTKTALQIHHSPLPWSGNRTLARGEISQIFCQKHIHFAQNASALYFLGIITPHGERLTVLDNMHSLTDLLYLEQEIETWLGIVNTRVRMERPLTTTIINREG